MTPEALVLELLKVERGHFRYESGYHGEIWLDLDLLFLDPRRLRPAVEELAHKLESSNVEVVVGPLVGGAFLAQTVAAELGISFCHSEPVPVMDSGKLYPVSYRLPPQLAPHIEGRRAAIVDDVINAGSAVRGTFDALAGLGAMPVAAGALLVLGETALPFLRDNNVRLECIASLPARLWEPEHCPLCARGVPLAA